MKTIDFFKQVIFLDKIVFPYYDLVSSASEGEINFDEQVIFKNCQIIQICSNHMNSF